VTVERDMNLGRRALENLRAAEVDDMVDLVIEDAARALDRLDTIFDMIFLDIEKKTICSCP